MNIFMIEFGSRSRSLLLAGLLILSPAVVTAETLLHGAPVYPSFEGWHPNSDGTFNLMFGYMNENWEEMPFIEVGDNNFFSPGDADQGQPTNFMPRRNRFTFEVTVPADWGDRELVWDLNINGVAAKAYGTLKPDYLVDNIVIASETGSLGIGVSSPESRANVPPSLTVQGDVVRTAKVGEAITLRTHLVDDGLPRSRAVTSRDESDLHRAMFRAPQKPTVNKINALYLNFIAIDNNDTNIFSSLIDNISIQNAEKSYNYLLIGIDKNDPLCKSMSKFRSFTYNAIIYIVDYSNINNKSNQLNYLELSRL
jgi:hypothetical protein